jgi:hypothetical protein
MPFINYVPFDRAKAMTDAVNNAETEQQHRDARLRLEGYKQRCEEIGQTWPCVELDLSADESRPMCCGIYNDWQPVEN